MHLLSIVLSSLLLGLVTFFLTGKPKIRRNGQPLRRPPNTLPLAGNGLLFLRARHKLFSWFVKCERQFGFETFEIAVPSLPPGVVINDPKNLEYILKNEGVFAKGAFFKLRSWDLFGNGIINADGELWKLQRKAGLEFLNKSNLEILTEFLLPVYLNSTIAQLESRSGGPVVDLENVFLELTTQLMGRMAYDMDMHANDTFSRSFEFASGATGERVQNPLWQITEFFLGYQLRRSVAEVKRFGDVIVERAVIARELRGVVDIEHEGDRSINTISGSLINSLLDSISNRQIVADAALNYLSAGRDTTAQALTWTFYLLMRHPKVVTRLRQDLLKLSKTNEDGIPTLEPSALQPTLLPYTMAIFYETLRLYPPVPIELKQCERGATLPDGTFLPKGAVVVWCLWAMNRSKIIWGKDAELFRPERWFNKGKLVTKSAYEFPVFNGGSRTCLGKRMAECVAVTVIARLIWEFDFNSLDDKERISRNSLTLPMEGGLPCLWVAPTKAQTQQQRYHRKSTPQTESSSHSQYAAKKKNMCVTTITTHKCGHEIIIDTAPCRSYRQSAQLIDFMNGGNAPDIIELANVARVNLDVLLADLQGKCAIGSFKIKVPQSAECETCCLSGGLATLAWSGGR